MPCSFMVASCSRILPKSAHIIEGEIMLSLPFFFEKRPPRFRAKEDAFILSLYRTCGNTLNNVLLHHNVKNYDWQGGNDEARED